MTKGLAQARYRFRYAKCLDDMLFPTICWAATPLYQISLYRLSPHLATRHFAIKNSNHINTTYNPTKNIPSNREISFFEIEKK